VKATASDRYVKGIVTADENSICQSGLPHRHLLTEVKYWAGEFQTSSSSVTGKKPAE